MYMQHKFMVAKIKADTLLLLVFVICLWKRRRKNLSLLLPSLLKICFFEVLLCFLSLAVCPSFSPPPFAAPVDWLPTSCPPATRSKFQMEKQYSVCIQNSFISLHTVTCQASSSWDSTTLCLMVLRSCWVSDSFSWRTMANSLSKELDVDMIISKTWLAVGSNEMRSIPIKSMEMFWGSVTCSLAFQDCF